jgi:hypothetical protein
VTFGVGLLGLHLWAAQGVEVFLVSLRICLLAGGPMALAMVAVELVRHARQTGAAEERAASEAKAKDMRGER